MAKTKDEWKAEAKKLKARVKDLRARLETELAPVVEGALATAADVIGDAAQAAATAVRKKASPVSPLAPRAGSPRCPDRRCGVRGGRGRGSLRRAHGRHAHPACSGHDHRRRLHDLGHAGVLRTGLRG